MLSCFQQEAVTKRSTTCEETAYILPCRLKHTCTSQCGTTRPLQTCCTHVTHRWRSVFSCSKARI